VTDPWSPWAIALALVAVANLINAGAFLAFSVMVMPTLQAVSAEVATQTMRELNRRAPRPVFMLTFLGAPLIAVILVVAMAVAGVLTFWVAAATALTVAAFVVSAVGNIPLNDRLQRVDIEWDRFSSGWNQANHARLVLSCLGGLVAIAGLLAQP
jgi:uncharacterized membrane protein